MKPNADELASLWAYSYARASLLEAVDFIDALTSLGSVSTVVARALSCSIVVSYARPFTQSQVTRDRRIIPLAGIETPPGLASTHAMTLKLRNKVVGHKDAIRAEGDIATPNVVLFKRYASGFDLHTVIVEGIAPELLTKLGALCTHFLDHCESQLQPLIGKYMSAITSRPPGVYELVMEEQSSEWIRPHNVA